MDGPTAQGFLSLTALQAEGCGGALRARILKKRRGSAAGSVEGLWKKVLKMDRPLAGGFLSLTAFRAEGCGGALRAQILKKRGAPSVISTEAKRSGEISPSDGTGGITVGDLSTQSIMGAVPVCLPYRHVPPLEMTMLASTSGHTFCVRVHRVHKVQRIQRVVVAASPQILKKAGLRPPSFRRKPVSRQ